MWAGMVSRLGSVGGGGGWMWEGQRLYIQIQEYIIVCAIYSRPRSGVGDGKRRSLHGTGRQGYLGTGTECMPEGVVTRSSIYEMPRDSPLSDNHSVINTRQ